ncbi:MAG: hypothetical protein IJU20_03885 [Clostridia bacterium]|nr:hypothetical protein [Clostridia bacterium]
MKRILLFVLVPALILLLAGCSPHGGDKTADTEETLASVVERTGSVTDAPGETDHDVPPETDAPGPETTDGDGGISGGVELPIDHFD